MPSAPRPETLPSGRLPDQRNVEILSANTKPTFVCADSAPAPATAGTPHWRSRVMDVALPMPALSANCRLPVPKTTKYSIARDSNPVWE